MNSVTFKQAVKMGATETENGMPALRSTGNELVDLFFTIGAARNMDHHALLDMFNAAYAVDPLNTMKILFWARDVRGGAGERQIFRNIINYLDLVNPPVVAKNMHLIPVYGRWDDVLVLQRTKQVKDFIADVILNQRDGYKLAAKWMPRQGHFAMEMAKHCNISHKNWRKLLVRSSDTVEQKMCAQDWTKIEYSHLPSIAAKRYQQAFLRHDADGYAQYKVKLSTGEAKVNAGAIFPHDVVVSCFNGDEVVSQAQWEALPNYMGDNKALAMIDTSGSMGIKAGGSNVECIDIALALGLYVAEKQTGGFKDTYLTFSNHPSLRSFQGNTVKEKLSNMDRDGWDMNTNIVAAFDEILNVALRHSIHQDNMPEYLIILSDMQFDQCAKDPNASAMDTIETKFMTNGYKVPKVVFWNLRAASNVPVSFTKSGVSLVSGFSPAIMGAVLSGESMTPYEMMMNVIGSDRYMEVTV